MRGIVCTSGVGRIPSSQMWYLILGKWRPLPIPAPCGCLLGFAGRVGSRIAMTNGPGTLSLGRPITAATDDELDFVILHAAKYKQTNVTRYINLRKEIRGRGICMGNGFERTSRSPQEEHVQKNTPKEEQSLRSASSKAESRQQADDKRGGAPATATPLTIASIPTRQRTHEPPSK